MRTQQCTYELRGHTSSVKQIRFQPGTGNNVLATSSRGGKVIIHDLRCKPHVERSGLTSMSLNGNVAEHVDHLPRTANMRSAAKVAEILLAHTHHSLRGASTVSRTSRQPGRPAVSVTAMSFLQASTPHLLLTGSEIDATVRLWDLRTARNVRDRQSRPLTISKQPEAHRRHRNFGMTSMTLNGDCSRFFNVW